MGDLKLILGDGRHIGMSEEEWNRIVMKNLKDHQDEEDARKQKLKGQRELIRDELSRQMREKQEKVQKSREDEKHDFEKLARDMRLKTEKEQQEKLERQQRVLQGGADVSKQLEQVTARRKINQMA